jgi:diacylglycerol kinase family enzyme
LRVVGTIDGQAIELSGLSDLIVKNTRVYAGAWVFDENARSDDGIFELVPFVGKNDWVSKAIRDLEVVPLNEEMLEQIGLEHSKLLRGSVMDLEIFDPPGGAPLATQLDGEEWPPSSRVRIEVAPRALRLIVPA